MAVRPLPANFAFTTSTAMPRVNTVRSDDQRVRPFTPRALAGLTNAEVGQARFATRERRGMYRSVNPRGGRELFGAVLNITRHSGANIMAAIKFVLMRDPTLLGARTEVILFEVVYQLANHRQAEWMDQNRNMVQELFGIVKFTGVTRLISAVRNGDGDVEANAQALWDEWQRRDTDTGPTEDQTDAAVEKRLRLKWVRLARTAECCVTEANVRRGDPAANLIPLAPVLGLTERFPPRSHRPLRATTIPAVQSAT